MKHLFVNYELALLAKEKGFNEPCLALFLDSVFYNHASDKFIHAWEAKECKNEGMEKWAMSAPLYQQLVDWFREKHNILIHEQWDGHYVTKKERANLHTFFKTKDLALTESLKLI